MPNDPGEREVEAAALVRALCEIHKTLLAEEDARRLLDTAQYRHWSRTILDAAMAIERLSAAAAVRPAPVAFEEESLIKREIATDAERKPCPACKAQNVFLAHSVRNLDARRHVECRICGVRGPIKTDNEAAIKAWNDLPRPAPVVAEPVSREAVKPWAWAWRDTPGKGKFEFALTEEGLNWRKSLHPNIEIVPLFPASPPPVDNGREG